MKIQWIPVALLSSTLVLGCNDRAQQNSQNFEANTGAPVPAAPPSATDQSGARAQPLGAGAPTSEGARPTTGVSDTRLTGPSHHATIDRPTAPPDVPIRQTL